MQPAARNLFLFNYRKLSISKIYIDQDIKDSPLVASILSHLACPSAIVSKAKDVYDTVSSSDDPIGAGKQTLYLTRNKGSFIKSCPGTQNYRCCGYKILHVGTYCILDCSYCILQAYFHPPVLQLFLNHADLFDELDMLFAKKRVTRIGTGEFTDSLIWENFTDLTSSLIKHFADQSSVVLELKTKTTAIDRLKSIKHNKKTIISWSLNTEKIIQNQERRTSSLSQRLWAAKQCESWGYPLAFHFDPIFIYDGCEKDYKHVISRLFSHVSPDNIVWISLGTFRFIPSLKPIIQKLFPDSKIIYEEFISGLDNKMRYFKPLRIRLYKQIVSWIKDIAPDVMLYFCMEDDTVWEKTMGFVPSDSDGLSNMLDKSAVEHCDLSGNIFQPL